MTQVVTQLIVDASGSTQGAAAHVAAMEKAKAASAAAANVTVSSFDRAQQKLQQVMSSNDQVYGAQLKAQREIERHTATLTRSVQLGQISQAAANAELAKTAQRHQANIQEVQKAAAANTLYGRSLQAANDNLRGFASNAGLAGQALLALGPWGIAAGAGIGVALLALNLMAREANRFADEMGKLRDTAQIIDLTTTQLQALNDKGAEFALTPEKIASGLQKFTEKLEEARRGEGELFIQLQRIDPVMALQFARTRDTASALDLYAQALAKVSAAERVSLSKAGLGKGGFDTGLMLQSVAKGGGLSALTEDFKKSGDAIDTEMIEKVRTLKREIDDMASDARNNIASVFSVSTLEAEKRFTENWLEFSRSVKNFSITHDLRYLLETVLKIRIGGSGTLLGALGIDFGAKYQAPPAPPKPDTFAERFQPANDNPLKPFSMGERDRNAKVLDLNLYRQEIALLGDAATAGERYKLRQLEINAAVAQNPRLQDMANRALAAASEAFKLDRMRANVAALGEAATAVEQYAVHVGTLQQQLSRGDITQETFNRKLRDMKADLPLQEMEANISALGNAATASEQYELRVGRLQQQLERGKISQETFNRAVLASNPAFQQAMKYSEQFTTSLVSGLMSGRSLVESLNQSLNNLANMAANAAVKNLLEGNFAMAAVDAVVAIGSKLAAGLFDDSAEKDLKKAQEAWLGMKDAMLDFVNEANTQTVSAFRQMRKSAEDLWMAATKAGDAASAALISQEYVRRGIDIAEKFANPKTGMSDDVRKITDLQDEARKFIDELNRMGFVWADQAAIMRGVGEQVAAIKQQIVDGLQADINDALGRGYLNEFNTLIAETQRFRDEAGVTGADPVLIGRRFEVVAQKIVDGADLTGEKFNELLSIFPNLTNVVHASTSAIEEQVRAQEELRNGAARTVVDFLASLQSGPNATVSPLQNYANSRQFFETNDALAFGGNIDAQNKWSELAKTFLDASRAVNASGAAFQADRSQVIERGQALPAVQAVTDPAVVAIRDSIAAIQNTTAAVDVMKLALQTAITSANPANTAVALLPYFSSLTATTGGLMNQAQFQSVLYGMASVTALRDMFTRLDTDASGGLTQAELTAARTATTNTQLNTSNALIDNAVANLNTVITQLSQTVGGIDTSNVVLNGINTFTSRVVSAINEHGGMSAAHFIAMNTNLAWIRNYTSRGPNGVNDLGQMPSVGFVPRAAGGWIDGGIPGRDSVPVMAMPDEFMVRASATRALTSQFGAGIMDTINQGRLPANVIPFRSQGGGDDNSALIAEVKEVRKELVALRRENAVMQRQIAEQTYQAGVKVAAASDVNTKKVTEAIGMKRRDQRERAVA